MKENMKDNLSGDNQINAEKKNVDRHNTYRHAENSVYYPNKEIKDIEQVVMDFRTIIDSQPQTVIRFIMQCFECRINNRVAIYVAHEYISRRGWNNFLNISFSSELKDLGLLETGTLMHHIVKLLIELRFPKDLALPDLEHFLNRTRNDIDWINLKAYIENSRKVEDMESYGDNETLMLLDRYDVPPFNIDLIRKEILEMIDNQSVYDELIDKITEWELDRDNKHDHNTVKAGWQQLPKQLLVKKIHPNFLYLFLQNYQKDFTFSRKDRLKLVKNLIENNHDTYRLVFSQQESFESLPYGMLNNAYIEKYNLMPFLIKAAESVGRKSLSSKLGYATNAVYVPLAKETVAIFGPEGDILMIMKSEIYENGIKEVASKERTPRISELLEMYHWLLDKNHHPIINSVAVCLSFWKILPEDIKEMTKKNMARKGIDMEEVVVEYGNLNYDYALSTAYNLHPYVSPELPLEMEKFLVENIAKRTANLPEPKLANVDTIIDQSIKDYSSYEYLDAKNALAVLNFSSIRYLKESLDLDMSLISFREFFSLFVFLKNQKHGEGYTKLKRLIGSVSDPEEKMNRVKSFLCLEIDKRNGEKIIEIGDKLSQNKSCSVFNKIAKLVDLVEKEKKDMENIFFPGKTSTDLRRNLIDKAQKIIVDFADALEKDPEKYVDKLLATLDNTKIEIELLHSILKSAKENNENVPFEIIRDLRIETKEIGEDLTLEEKQEILEISRKNYFDVVFEDELEKAQIVVDDLKKEFFPEKFLEKKEDEVKNQRAYTLKYKGRVVAFCKFKQIPGKPDELEFTSVNVSPELHGLKVGEYFISKVLEIESKKHIINGDTFVKNAAANKLYFEKVGFEKEEENESEKYLGEKLYKMRMDKREKQ